MTRFASVVIDVDSTLSQIEGIEWLAGRCDPAVQERIAATTAAAMRGDIPLEAVYGERLSLVRPSRQDVDALGRAYVEAITPGAKGVIETLHDAGARVVVVSGGVREAILPLAAYVGVSPDDTHAVSLQFDAEGNYLDYDRTSPVTRRGGKPEIVNTLGLPAPILAIGDGITDAELTPIVDTFIAFTGVVRHERVVAAAHMSVSRFVDLLPILFP